MDEVTAFALGMCAWRWSDVPVDMKQLGDIYTHTYLLGHIQHTYGYSLSLVTTHLCKSV